MQGYAVSDQEYLKLVDATAAAESVVLLIADEDLRTVTSDLTNALSSGDEETVQTLIPEFIDLAQEDIADPGG